MLSFLNRVSSRSSKVDLAAAKEAEEADHHHTQPEPPTAVPEDAEAPATLAYEDDDAAPASPVIANVAELDPQTAAVAADTRPSVSIYSSDVPQPAATDDAALSSAAVSTVPATQVSHEPATELKRPAVPPAQKQRRLSWRPLSFRFLNNQDPEHDAHTDGKPALSAAQEQKKKLHVAEDRAKRAVRVSSADKKAKESAVIVRSLIVGPTGIVLPAAKAKPISKPKIEKVKSQLLNAKTANRVIAQLRAMPSYAETVPTPSKENHDAGEHQHQHTTLAAAVPIHAVCLPLTDTEAEEKHFSKLKDTDDAATSVAASVLNSPLTQIQAVFSEIDAVSLFSAQSFGLGEPGDGQGILAGAIPTAKTVIDGIQQITPQLMAFGYATGRSILPDHEGVHPPTDRMSVLTYWWGFEIALPPPSIAYLSKAPSIAHSLINVLTALAAVNNGVREILPFVRYISQYIDAEFNMIKTQDQGKGVVCAATWLVPVALVPRPWDFTPAPIVTIQPAPADDPSHPSTDHKPAADAGADADPTSPPMPPSRPVSPPTLLPPLELHSTGFGEPEAPAKANPIDSTPVIVDSEGAVEVPAVAVVPPTPTGSGVSTRTRSVGSEETERAVAV